jgi:alkylation response protein AidB-like acyl-CoA dehydrogenase
MSHYKSNLRDIEFNLFEVFASDKHGADGLGEGRYAELDPETARSVLAEVERLATHELADSAIEADRNPPDFDPTTHSVTLPESFKRAFKAWQDAEWWRFALPEELGGQAATRALRWSIAELVCGANPAVWMYSSFADMAKVIALLGTDEQRASYGRHLVDKRWTATMVLTEADAGSDVGAGRTRAIQQPDGTWHIEGVKRFITSGEHDLSDNIIHFVLARPEGAGPGTKGLSLFLVPKFHFDPVTGELGERNGVFATNVEHKMGLKVSTTCEMTFGQNGVPAVGVLLGEKHDGIRQMFMVIEFARMMVGTKAIATLSTGYLNALDYAKERVQGPELARAGDPNAPRVTITHHPDVRRMLMQQKAYVEGMRALVHYTSMWQDVVEQATLDGGELDATAKLAASVNDLLLPIVKGYGSERSYEQLALSLQTLGGSGYLQDYPIEQYIRDAKIDTLYEGTTGIQGNDFFFRKIVRDQGRALTRVNDEITAFLTAETGGADLATERALLAAAQADVGGMVAVMLGRLQAAAQDPSLVNLVGLHTTRLLLSCGDLVVGWLLLRQAAVALAALPTASERDRDFYTGKVAAARFFARNVLPQLSSARAILEAGDDALMEVPESAF